MQVREIMSSNIQSIDYDASIRSAAQQILDLDVGMLPVQADGEIVGIVTDRDITVRATAKGADPEATPVGEVMSDEIIGCSDEEELDLAVDIMAEHQVRRLLVQDRAGLVSMLSLADLARHVETLKLGTEVLSEVSQVGSPIPH